MARSRLNPWPPVADLFSALTVVSLAGFIMVTLGAVVITVSERVERDAAKELAEVFAHDYGNRTNEHVTVLPCSDRPREQCIDIDFRFERNGYKLSEEGERQVERACSIYGDVTSKIINQFRSQGHRLALSNISLQIEGHTDSTMPPQGEDRDRFLYNWILSSRRAATVLYEFRQKCRVSPDDGYEIRSVGLAATRPICSDLVPGEACHERNRRTTMRIRVEYMDQVRQERPTPPGK